MAFEQAFETDDLLLETSEGQVGLGAVSYLNGEYPWTKYPTAPKGTMVLGGNAGNIWVLVGSDGSVSSNWTQYARQNHRHTLQKGSGFDVLWAVSPGGTMFLEYYNYIDRTANPGAISVYLPSSASRRTVGLLALGGSLKDVTIRRATSEPNAKIMGVAEDMLIDAPIRGIVFTCMAGATQDWIFI